MIFLPEVSSNTNFSGFARKETFDAFQSEYTIFKFQNYHGLSLHVSIAKKWRIKTRTQNNSCKDRTKEVTSNEVLKG